MNVLRFASILAVGLFFANVAGAQLSRVGDTLCGAGATTLAVAPDGTLYAAWQSADKTFELRRYNGTSWQHLPSPPVRNGSFFISLATDRSGVLYLATDTMHNSISDSRVLILKYESAQWKTVGVTSRFINPATGMEPTLAFDAQDHPVYAFSGGGGAVIRFNGKNWDQIAGAATPFQYLSMATDSAGAIYTVSGDTTVSKYSGNATWTPLSKTGLEHVDGRAAVLTASPSGALYAEFLPAYGAGRTSLHRYTGTSWVQMGRTFQSVYLSRVLTGAGGGLYTFSYNRTNPDSVRILRYNGMDWITVAADDATRLSSRVVAHDGNLYAAIAENDSVVRVMKYDTRNDALSVEKPTIAQPVSVAPVPASHSLEIRNVDPAWNGKSASIVDMQGRAMTRVVLEPTFRVDMASWPAGMYQLLLPGGQALKVIKN